MMKTQGMNLILILAGKTFVNQENREMHILCNTQRSEDRESSLTTSSIMISQRSIKTFITKKQEVI